MVKVDLIWFILVLRRIADSAAHWHDMWWMKMHTSGTQSPPASQISLETHPMIHLVFWRPPSLRSVWRISVHSAFHGQQRQGITPSKCTKCNETLANVISKGACNLSNVYVPCTGLCTTLLMDRAGHLLSETDTWDITPVSSAAMTMAL